MDYQVLRNEILTGPLAATLAPYVDLNASKQDAYAKDRAIADALNADNGSLIDDPETRAMLDEMSAGMLLSDEENDAFDQLAKRPSSRAYESVGEPVTADDVSMALRGNGGNS